MLSQQEKDGDVAVRGWGLWNIRRPKRICWEHGDDLTTRSKDTEALAVGNMAIRLIGA